MSAAAEGRGGGAVQLVKEFHAVHGLKGFATQGVLPEMLRATYMRVLKFFLFPICHKAVWGRPQEQGNGATKAVAAALASLPEGFTIAPIEVSKIALQLDKTNKYNNNMGAVVKDIIKTRGVPGLFI